VSVPDLSLISTANRFGTPSVPWIVSAVELSRRGVHIDLLGAFGVQVDGTPVDAREWRLRKARTLVAMLALAPGQRRHREQVLERLWPDLQPVAAARNLHQTLYVARRALAGSNGGSDGLLVIKDELIVLDEAGPVPVDVVRFERLAAAALVSGDEDGLRSAAQAYAGDLLPDQPSADWLTARREELREAHRAVLVRLASAVAGRAPDEALLLLSRVLESDPLHEGAVRALMTLLAAGGRRSEALARYERLRADLLEAFGTDPDRQTTAVFRELLTGAPPGPERRAPADHPERRGTQAGHLPTPVTSFVGRERELAEAQRLLGRARLLTLTGAGGCGKTRLAVQVAERVRSAYPDGVWFVDLVAVGESLLVADMVSEALGLEPGAGPKRGQSLVDQLRFKSALIVLDNCEHLLAACGHLVAQVLAGCPGIDVLATSREPLQAPGEFTFRVPSLALPAPGLVIAGDLAALQQLASVRLFVERAAQVRPGFALDADNAQGVVDLCRRLDGMPLALELAAARIAVLEPAEIVQRLGDALLVLGHGPIGITRHQTMRATLEWSHDLLIEREKILLRRIAVFAGSFTLPALEAICGGAPLDHTELLDLLSRLVDKSLVLAERTNGASRYRQLEPVRQFCRENLERAGEVPLLSAAHCAYYLDFAAAHDPEYAQGVVTEHPKVVDLEHDNLRAALRWSCAQDPESAMRLAAGLWRYWVLRGHFVEGARWVERALAAAPSPTKARARALLGLTGLDSRQGRADRHRALGAQALAVAQQLGDPDEVVVCRLMDATLALTIFDLDDAERLALDLRADASDAGRPEVVAATTWLLGQCALSREDGALAAARFTRCLGELAEADPLARPFLPVITPCMQLVPVNGRLVPCFEETLLMCRRVGVGQANGYVLGALGYAARLTGDPAAATASVGHAVEVFTELKDDLARAQALHQLGCLRRDSGDFAAAEAAFGHARDLRMSLGDRRGELLTEVNMALLEAMRGDVTAGLDAARRGLAAFEAIGDTAGTGGALTILAAIELLSGQVRAAREMYARAAEQLAVWGRMPAWQHLMVAELSVELADHGRAERETRTAAIALDKLGCVVAGQRLQALRSD